VETAENLRSVLSTYLKDVNSPLAVGVVKREVLRK
jgi:hypothetical protein